MTKHEFEGSAPQGSLYQLAALLQSAVDAIISIDANGLIESVNPATEKLFGYSTSELIGQNVKLLMPEPDRADHDAYIRQYRHTGQRRIIGIGREVIGRRRDGSTFPMHLSVSEYEIDGTRHFAGIVHDLTAQRMAEAADVRRQSLFESIVRDTPHAIVIADEERSIFLVNPAVARIFGYSSEELIGKKSRVLYASDDDYDRVAKLKLGLLENDEVTTALLPVVVALRRKSGEAFDGEVIANVVRDDRRRLVGVMAHIRDMTQQLKQEQALRHAQKMDALGQLTGGIAHDFNNLLTVITGNLELIEQTGTGVSVEVLARRANDAADMGIRLTSRLLTFSRQRSLQNTVVDLAALLRDMTEMLQRTLGATIEVMVTTPTDLWPVITDISQIENAVLNLSINARDAMPEGGRLIIEASNVSFGGDSLHQHYGVAPGDYVRLTVSDTGTGMPPEVVERAFEPFFTTKPPDQGTGLGLSSIYGFAKQSSGNATIYSEVGRGTSVNVYLPRARHETSANASDDVVVVKRGGETVLVVEDSPQLRLLTVTRLQLLGYRVLEAEDGPAALTILQHKRHIDLLFSDVVMPGRMTGYDLALRAKRLRPAIKTLLTSGYDAQLAAAQDKTGSNLIVLRKPYKQLELEQALRRAIED